MKRYKLVLSGVFHFTLSASSIANEQNMTDIIKCSLPGGNKIASLSIDNQTKEIKYFYRKANKIELSVSFDEKNKLKRLVDNKMGVTYYGFARGTYSYVFDVIEEPEREEYAISFDVKKNNKVIQSNDCLPNSFRNNKIESKYIIEVPYKDGDDFIFP